MSGSPQISFYRNSLWQQWAHTYPQTFAEYLRQAQSFNR
jgi:hypothetical protein